MNDAMKSFISALGKDQSLRSKIEGARMDDALATAKAHGHDITAQDLHALVAGQGELDDASLDGVSGGILTSFQITLPEGLISIPAPEEETSAGSSGSAVNSLCLGDNNTVGNSWACTDEEVTTNSSNQIRGTSNYRG